MTIVDTSDVSAILVRLVVLLGLLIGLPLLRPWAGGQLRAYLVAFGGLLFIFMAEAVHLFNLTTGPNAYPTSIAWQTVATLGGGYVTVLFGLLLWIRDLRKARQDLQQANVNLQQMATTDYLTGLATRRQASFLLDFETARARRSGKPLGFIMIDLDHFKQVNDAHGHQAGDAVLTHVGKLLKGRLRGTDIVSRYGGEEFLVLIPGTDYQSTVELAETLRRHIEDSPVKFGDQEIPVRASFGVAVSHADAQDRAEVAISRADAALYAAKALGRNRVVGWQEIAPRIEEPVASRN